MDFNNKYLNYKLKYHILKKYKINMIGGRTVVPGACSLLYSCKNVGGRCYYMSVVTLLNNIKHRIKFKDGMDGVIEFIKKNMDCYGENNNVQTEDVCKILPVGVGREINKIFQKLSSNKEKNEQSIQEGGDSILLLEAFLRRSNYYDGSNKLNYTNNIFEIPPEGISSDKMNSFISFDRDFYKKQEHIYFKVQGFKNNYSNITYEDGYIKLIKSLIEIKKYNEQFGIILVGGLFGIYSSSESTDGHAISFSFCNNYDNTYIIYLCDPNIDNCKIIYDTRTDCFTHEGNIKDIQNKLSFSQDTKKKFLKQIYFSDGTLLFINERFTKEMYQFYKQNKTNKENEIKNKHSRAIQLFNVRYNESLTSNNFRYEDITINNSSEGGVSISLDKNTNKYTTQKIIYRFENSDLDIAYTTYFKLINKIISLKEIYSQYKKDIGVELIGGVFTTSTNSNMSNSIEISFTFIHLESNQYKLLIFYNNIEKIVYNSATNILEKLDKDYYFSKVTLLYYNDSI